MGGESSQNGRVWPCCATALDFSTNALSACIRLRSTMRKTPSSLKTALLFLARTAVIPEPRPRAKLRVDGRARYPGVPAATIDRVRRDLLGWVYYNLMLRNQIPALFSPKNTIHSGKFFATLASCYESRKDVNRESKVCLYSLLAHGPFI